ncbi:MAG: serine--tRNA ligase [Bacteroidota bacterium]|nr:serine--tRNA ligase [Bacteroidota bacterium]
MIQLKEIIENKDKVINGLKKRGFKKLNILDEIINTDKSRRNTQKKLDDILFKSNNLSSEISELYKKGKNKEASVLKKKSATLKKQSKDLNERLRKIKSNLIDLRCEVPNVPDEKVSEGKDENDNVLIDEFGENRKLNNLLTHWELSKKYNIIDFETGNKITGSGFPLYIGKGAKLKRALINFFLDRNMQAGYTECQVPLLINESSAFGTGQLPDKEGQMYHVTVENLFLIPTSEVPLTNMFRDKTLDENKIPIKLTAFTPCFRREAGSYGSNVRGLNRLHQFDKVEIVRLEKPEDSQAALYKMIDHIKNILIELELPSRIMRLCGKDLGFTSSITYDFELFSPAQKKWLEISSVSNFKTFQTERLNLKFKNQNGEKIYLHSLNGSSLALPRVIASLLENFQTNEGIKIPESLVPYTGFNIIN